ncbi:histidine triad nucleotide-binding protein [Allostella sp. ATCC 35155]|nr:histidine triad nucleotide-binding protein [Stella sp. ATCC 35155]
MSYDDSNIFARVLRGEIPCRKVFEDEHVLAFEDIRPLAPTHVLIIPKGRYVSAQDFSENAGEAEIVAFVRAIGRIARERGIDASGHRILANHGSDGRQEVPHFHLHLVGGRDLGRMLSPAKE